MSATPGKMLDGAGSLDDCSASVHTGEGNKNAPSQDANRGSHPRVGVDKGNGTTAPLRMARTLSFARRTRALTPAQQRAFTELAPHYLLELERGIGETTIAPGQSLDLVQVFGREAALTLEIGAGSGEQIVAAAARHPEQDFLAYEVWRPGIARMMNAARAAGVQNLRIVDVDAVQSLPILLDAATVSEVWTFFPDPWRKARHRKRRLVRRDFAREIARVLVDGGCWRLATDWDDYANQMLEVIWSSPDLSNPYQDVGCPHPESFSQSRSKWSGQTAELLVEQDQLSGHILEFGSTEDTVQNNLQAGEQEQIDCYREGQKLHSIENLEEPRSCSCQKQRESRPTDLEVLPETWYAPRFSGRVLTKFEERGIAAGRQVRDILAIRVSRKT